MSEATNGYPPLKRRWIGAALGFLVGGTAHAYLVWESLGFVGAGHGHVQFGNLFDGPFELSFFLFPFACAAAASGWIPAVTAALVWECVHHVTTLNALFQIPEVFHDMGRYHPGLLPDLWWTYGIYFATRLTALAVIGFEIYRWRNRERGTHPQRSQPGGEI